MGLFQRKAQAPGCAAVIVAAGSSRRMGGIDKILWELEGVPVLRRTAEVFQKTPCIQEMVVVVRREQVETAEAMLRDMDKLRRVVPGGESRVESVSLGLRAVSRDIELVAVQDGARPLITQEIITRTVERAAVCHAAAPAVPVKDTVKVAEDSGRVISTPDRATLRAVQTPQVFQRDLLLAAWEVARREGKEYTDDCAAMEAFGVPVYLTQGSEENLKLTTPLDLRLAEYILSGREKS